MTALGSVLVRISPRKSQSTRCMACLCKKWSGVNNKVCSLEYFRIIFCAQVMLNLKNLILVQRKHVIDLFNVRVNLF